MPLRFYNTLTQQTAEFSPERDNTVRMYTCGPTVYDLRAHRQFPHVHVSWTCCGAGCAPAASSWTTS